MKHPLSHGEGALPHAILALEDGTLFHGIGIGAAGQASGEVVFNTAMTGYQEILTGPSYSRQLVTLTYPHIGNTGINHEDGESERVHAASLPASCRLAHVSLFGGSLQGFARIDRPAFCFQGHPEAAPGPHDLASLFGRFITLMENAHHA